MRKETWQTLLEADPACPTPAAIVLPASRSTTASSSTARDERILPLAARALAALLCQLLLLLPG